MRSRRIAALMLLLPCLGACAVRGDGGFAVAEGQEASTFDAARHVLRDYRFTLERVDAAAGEITTRDFPSAGLGTPWDGVQSTPGQEVSDFLNQQFRRVRISIAPPGAEGPRGQVEAFVYRVQTPNLRLSGKSWQTARVAIDPALSARGISPGYSVATRRDTALEARIARSIEHRLNASDVRHDAP